jgi:hypothetical protein
LDKVVDGLSSSSEPPELGSVVGASDNSTFSTLDSVKHFFIIDVAAFESDVVGEELAPLLRERRPCNIFAMMRGEDL